MNASGTELLPGENWGVPPDPTVSAAVYGSYAAHKIFYPFGPATTGMRIGVYGTMGGWDF